MIYLARSKFSRSLLHKKKFSFIWQAVFKLGHVFYQDRWDTSSEFEWTLRKVASDNNSRQICKQAIIKLSLAYSFREMFFIGQNLNHLHMKFFLNFWSFFALTQVDIDCLRVFFSPHHRNIVSEDNSKENQSWNKNKHFNLFLSWNENKHFHLFLSYEVKNSLWTIFIFSLFHEHIFWSSRSQMFFKIGVLRDFGIFRIKKRLRQRCFSVNFLIS